MTSVLEVPRPSRGTTTPPDVSNSAADDRDPRRYGGFSMM
jgi:hypothetical protein